MKTSIKIFILLQLVVILFSCKSQREKRIEEINKESMKIFATMQAEVIINGYKINTDSLMRVYSKIAGDSAELGLEYAKQIRFAVASIKAKGNETGEFHNQNGNEQQVNNANQEAQKLEILSHNQKINKDPYGTKTCSIYVVVKNNSNKAIDMVFLKATWFDENNNVVAVQLGYDNNIEPGAKSTIEIFSTQVKKIFRYELKVDKIDYK